MKQEIITFLQQYLAINTAQPNPDYASARALLIAQAKKDGFPTQEIILPSGNSVLIISYYALQEKLSALVLNHHMDVVPKSAHDTFADGTINQDHMYGRGTQDMKGVGVAHYFALKQLKESGIPIERTIHLFAVPDEEIGGFTGTGQLVISDAFKKLNVGYVIDEGMPSGNAQLLLIKIAERKPLQLKFECKGQLSHASTLQAYNPIARMSLLMARFAHLHQGEQEKAINDHAGLYLSLQITSCTAGKITNGTIAYNIVPDHAIATVDMRVPPTMRMQQAHKLIASIMQHFPDIEYSINAVVNDLETKDMQQSSLYITMSKIIANSGLQTKPHYFEASSDLRFYLEQGIEGIGFTPFTAPANLHGTNESIPLEDLMQAKELFFAFLVAFCTKQGKP